MPNDPLYPMENMRLQKTDLAKNELQPGVRTLGQRERSLLLLADGLSTASYLSSLFQGEGEKLVLHLVKTGYLSEVPLAEPKGSRNDGPADISSHDKNRLSASMPALTASVPLSVDQFDGKRSLATTRMFLFDICERMFSRRAPEQAEFFRTSLRNSRDRISMLAAGREMLLEVEKVAGYERADSIRERIAMLLPPEEMRL